MPAAARILLVDARRDQRQMYAELLQQRGACTIQASNAREALRAALELQPDLVVTDVRLGEGASGLALTRYLKRRVTPPIPVIVLTAYLLPGATRTARRAGCDRFLSKPCMPEVLADAIRELLGQRATDTLPPPMVAAPKSHHVRASRASSPP